MKFKLVFILIGFLLPMVEGNPPEKESPRSPEVLPSCRFNQRLYLQRLEDVHKEFKETFSGMRRFLEETRELIDSILKDIKAGGSLLEENNFLEDKIAILEGNKLKIETFHEMAKHSFDLAVRKPYKIHPSFTEFSNEMIAEMQDAIFQIRSLQEDISKLTELYRRKNEN